jgi:hypothetical protein
MTAPSRGIKGRISLLRLNPGFLDDRPPLLDFSLLESGETFRRLLLARSDV